MRLNLIVIKTHQLEALVHFYQLLGLSFIYHQHGSGPFHYSTQLNGLTFELYPLPKTATVDSSTRLGLVVPNLDLLLTKLQKEAVLILKKAKQSPWGYTALIQDLDGRKIELTEEKSD